MELLEAIGATEALRWFRRNRRVWTARRAAPVGPSDVCGRKSCRVVGRAALAVDPTSAPFTQTPACAWFVRLEQKRVFREFVGNDLLRNDVVHWGEQIRARSTAPLYVVDDAGG